MNFSSLKVPIKKVFSKTFLKFYSLGYLGITILILFATWFDGITNSINDIFRLLGAMTLGFILFFMVYVFVYVLILFDYKSLPDKPTSPDWLEKITGTSLTIFEKVVSGFFKLILICLAIAGSYFLLGGIVGILKFGWRQM